MNKLTNLKFLLAFLLTSFYACNQPRKLEVNNQESLKDSNFVLTKIENLDFIDKLNWDFENLYLDSSKKQKFEKLSNELKIKYLKDFLSYADGSKMPVDWIISDLQAFIIVKRPKIEDFQPTIIKVYGTDFAAVILVNINESGDVKSGFPIYSVENSGPDISEDTLIITRPKTKCKFEYNWILTSKQIGTCHPQNGEIQTFSVKQVNFKTTISKSGEIVTVKLDSAEFVKKCELEYFQSY